MDAKEKINDVEKKSEGGNEPDDNKPTDGEQQKPDESKNKKCGGELSASGFALSFGVVAIAVAAGAIAVRKKARKE